MPLRVSGSCGDAPQKLHSKMSRNGHYQKVRRPTGLEVYNDAARILEELLEKRLDDNLRAQTRVRRNRTDPQSERHAVHGEESGNAVARSQTMPSRYRESKDEELKKKDLEVLIEKAYENDQAGEEGSVSSADSEYEELEGKEKRKKKSLFKRAKERLIHTFHRDQKEGFGKYQEPSDGSSTLQKRRKMKKKEDGLSGSDRHIHAHLNDDKSIDSIERHDKKGRSSLLDSFRKPKKSSERHAVSHDETGRAKDGHAHKSSGVRDSKFAGDTVTRGPSGSQGEDEQHKLRLPSFGLKGGKGRGNVEDKHSGRSSADRDSVSPGIPPSPAQPNSLTTSGDRTSHGHVPAPPPPASTVPTDHTPRPPPPPPSKLTDDLTASRSVTPPPPPSRLDGLSRPSLLDSIKGGSLKHVDHGGGSPSSSVSNVPSGYPSEGSMASILGGVLPSQGSSVLDSPGEDIEYIDDNMHPHGIRYHGSDGLLNMQWLADRTANSTRAAGLNTDQRTAPAGRTDGHGAIPRAPGQVAGMPLVREEDEYGELPAQEPKSEATKEEMYGKIAQRLIEMADSYAPPVSDHETRGASAVPQVDLSELEKEIIECLRSGGDKYSKQIDEELKEVKHQVTHDAYQRFRSTVQNSMGSELSWDHLAFLFYTTKGVVSAVGRGTQVANQAKEFTLRYISDTFASWIMDQGGFDSMLSSSESDYDLD